MDAALWAPTTRLVLQAGEEIAFRGKVALSQRRLRGNAGEVVVTNQRLIYQDRARLGGLIRKEPLIAPLSMIWRLSEGEILDWIVAAPRLRVWLAPDLPLDFFGDAEVIRALADALQGHVTGRLGHPRAA